MGMMIMVRVYIYHPESAFNNLLAHTGDGPPPLMDLSDDEDSDGPLLPIPMSLAEEDDAWEDGV